MLSSPLSPSEIVYRCVRCAYVSKDAEGKTRIGDEAFADRDKTPSVDVASLREYEPVHTRREASDTIVQLVVGDIRALQSVVKRNDKGVLEFEYAIDVISDPIKDVPDLPDNPAHAKIVSVPKDKPLQPLNRSAWGKLKEDLVVISVVVLEASDPCPPDP